CLTCGSPVASPASPGPAPLPPAGRSSSGTGPADIAEAETILKPAMRLPTPTSARGSRPLSSSSVDHGRFTPGEIVADRYRIIEQIGKGGMGEVFRADDLKLGQQAALKFLPAAFERDAHRL